MEKRFTVVKTTRVVSLSGLKTRSFPTYRTFFMNVMETTTEIPMGKAIATLVITNRLDEGKAEDGLIPIEQVRSVTLENV